jgi:aromatic ring-opening dioxygenase catalytic subunit (LigB family)
MEIGRALGSLSERNVLLIGSGFSFHNLRAFFSPDTAEARELNQSFEKWLRETACSTDLSEDDRSQRLERWALAPGARFCHPREEHLLPFHVCYGAAQVSCTAGFELTIMNKKSSIYLW